MDFLQGLNPQQQEAAAHVDGPLLILAGAGSGKTRVITHRIAHLITAHGVPSYNLLAVTFTNKASAEMRQRITSLLAKAGASGTPVVSTFHSFCVRLLRREGDNLAAIRPGFTRNFTIYDDDEQVSIIKAIYKAIGLDEKFMQYRAALSRISHAKNHQETPQDFYKNSTDPKNSRLAVIFEKYEEQLRKANALDFDDLLLETVRLLRHDSEVRHRNNERIRYMMIDEYQDTNRSQYELMRLLSQRHDNICVVGDEDQSIYSWRGADIRNILDFEKDFPRAKTIRLEQNYRSTKNILEAASVVIANNKERKGKWLWTEAGEGDELTVYPAHDAENEALFIADTTEKVLRQHKDWRVAVLYRTNSQSRQIEEAMRRYGRKYNVVGGFSYYQRAEVKDIIAYLKLANSQADSISLGRIINVPARGIGKTTLDQAEKFAAENGLSLWDAIGRLLEENQFGTRAHSAMRVFRELILELAEAVRTKPLNEALAFIEDRTGYRRMLEQETSPDAETRIENLNELMNAAAEAVERGESITDFLDHAALVADSDGLDEAAQVTLMTIHNAKGLEFHMVVLAGMEEGLFPHGRSLNSESAMEEERRLCYVGMTRAEKRLVLTWAKYRRRFGGGEQERTIKSRFLGEVPSNLVISLGIDDSDDAGQVDLTAERYQVRQDARKNLYTGKTYNSVENVQQFFKDRGVSTPLRPTSQPAARSPLSRPAAPPAARPPAAPGGERMPWDDAPAIQQNRPPAPASSRPVPPPSRPVAPPSRPPAGAQGGLFGSPAPIHAPRPAQLVPPVKPRTELPKAPPATKSPSRTGTVVEHPKYGTGTIVRREGEGDDAKIVVSFQRHGLKKLVEKYAGLRNR